MSSDLHNTFIAWPNGGGETPCSEAFLQAHDEHQEQEALANEAERDEDWPAYTLHSARAEQARERMHALREQGHVGKPHEYGKVLPGMALLGGATMTADGKVFNGDHFVGQL